MTSEFGDNPAKLTKAQLATALGVTTRQVENWQSMDEFPPPERPGRANIYDLPAVVDWLVEHRISQRIGDPEDGETLDLNHERALLARSQRRHRDMLLERDAGNLVEIDKVAEQVGDEYSTVRAKLLAIPSKAAPLVAPITAPAQCRKIISDQVDEALQELSSPENVGT